MALRDVTWRLVYDRLRLKYKREQFRFEDALEVVYPGKKKFSGREVKYASKLLNEIEDNAYAIHTKASFDQRVRLYRLLNSEKVSNARAVYSTWGRREEPTYFGKILSDAGEQAGWEYMLVKDSAIARWTSDYRSVEVNHVSVSEKDVDGWIALFKLYDYTIILNSVLVSDEKSRSGTVHMHSDLEERAEQVAEIDNFRWQPAHYTVVEAFDDGDVQGALAVLAVKKQSLEWNRLIEEAKVSGVINTLGFSMEHLNRLAKKKIFKEE